MLFKDSLTQATLGETHLFSVGQAGFVIKSCNGKTLGIDLYLSDCVEPLEGHDGYHRLMPKIVEPENLLLDVVVATHFHRDHFDIDAIPALMANGKTRLVCAYDCQDDVKELGIDPRRVTFVKPGDQLEIDDFKLDFINCDHGSGAPLAVGVIIRVDGKLICEVGDTCLHLDWKPEYLKNGNLDVLIAPINGAYGNMTESENVELIKAINPGLAVPCHFGMFASHGGHPGLWKDLLETLVPGQRYKLFTMGEGIKLL